MTLDRKESSNRFFNQLRESVDFIQKKTQHKPRIGLVLGSGLGSLADLIENPTHIPYTDIPHFFGTSIEGHAGKMVLGTLSSIPIVCLQGRFHYYEGYSMAQVVFPTRVLCALGIHTLLLTNAAGGINTRYRPGDLMIINDHLNLMGDNPLKGPNLEELGPRFPDLSEAYFKEGVAALKQSAEELKITHHLGVYAGLIGPTYETPAEVRMMRTLGADAVGMSTVPESIAANHLGVRVAGVSCITNLAAGLSPQKLSHQEVIDTSKAAGSSLTQLLSKVIPMLDSSANSA